MKENPSPLFAKLYMTLPFSVLIVFLPILACWAPAIVVATHLEYSELLSVSELFTLLCLLPGTHSPQIFAWLFSQNSLAQGRLPPTLHLWQPLPHSQMTLIPSLCGSKPTHCEHNVRTSICYTTFVMGNSVCFMEVAIRHQHPGDIFNFTNIWHCFL